MFATAAKRLRSGRRVLRGSAAVLALVIIWELTARLGIVDSFLIPPPSTVVAHLFTLAGPSALPAYALWTHIGWSVLRLIAGVALGCVVGVPLGLAMGSNRLISLTFRPLLTLLLAVPSLALAPILILMIGLNNWVPIVIIAIETAVIMAYNAESGSSSIPKNMRWAMASLGAGKLGIFLRVVLPASLPSLVTALKLSVGYGWRALIAVESLAATAYGLGFMIFDAQNYMDTETIFAGIISIAIVGFTLERAVFGSIEKRINAWYAIAAREK